MIVRLSLDVSTQVTKSSILLERKVQRRTICITLNYSPRNKVCGIGYRVRTDADVPVLNKFDGLET
jgi:hypothetical protein